MARAAQQSAGAITIWMIIFAGLWLTAMVFLVVMYTGQEDLVRQNQETQKANSRLITSSQRQSIELIRNLVDGGETAVGVLEDARRQTAALAIGDENADATTVMARRNEVFSDIRRDAIVGDADAYQDDSLVEALENLYGDYKSQHGTLTETKKRLDEVGSTLESAETEKAKLATNFDEEVKKLKDSLAEIEADRADFRRDKDQAVTDMEADFEKRRGENDAALTSERLRVAQLEKELVTLRKRFLAREEKFGGVLIGPEALTTARQADGRILTAVPGDRVIYIDIGRDDRLTLGLRFAVYAADTGIPADGRAKGQIEVVSISDSSSECRILRVAPNELILEGDLIANPIYDPTQAQRFLIIGGFDLDGNGTPDPGGDAVVESLVSEWGGVVTDKLSAVVDFVVLGSEPEAPRSTERRDLSPEQLERNRLRQATWDRYVSVVESAKALSVPVLSQDVFLNFLGYRTQSYAGK